MKLNILTLIAFAASVLAKTGPGAAIHLGDVEQSNVYPRLQIEP